MNAQHHHTNQELMNAAIRLDKIIPCLYSINLMEYSILEMKIMHSHLISELEACKRTMKIIDCYQDKEAAEQRKKPIQAKIDAVKAALDTLNQQMMAI